MTQEEINEGNKIIAKFDGWIQDLETFKNNGDTNWIHPKKSPKLSDKIIIPSKPDRFKYHTSWDWIHPVYRKSMEIGLFMLTNGFEKLWFEKSKEIEYAMLHEETPQRAAILISQLIKWHNTQQHDTTN